MWPHGSEPRDPARDVHGVTSTRRHDDLAAVLGDKAPAVERETPPAELCPVESGLPGQTDAWLRASLEAARRTKQAVLHLDPGVSLTLEDAPLARTGHSSLGFAPAAGATATVTSAPWPVALSGAWLLRDLAAHFCRKGLLLNPAHARLDCFSSVPGTARMMNRGRPMPRTECLRSKGYLAHGALRPGTL